MLPDENNDSSETAQLSTETIVNNKFDVVTQILLPTSLILKK
jgi:hypothetical protein